MKSIPLWRPAMILLGLIPLVVAPACADPTGTNADNSGADDYLNPDRPGIADGSTVIYPKRFQIETGMQVEFRDRGAEHDQTSFLPTLLRIGIDRHWELRVEGNTYARFSMHDPAQRSTHDQGAAPVSIGAKVHFVDSAGVKQPSVGAIMRVFPASGSGAFGTTQVTGDMRLVADWNVAAKWSLNPNVGIGVYEGDAQRLYTAGLFALTLNFNPGKTLNLFVDTGVQSPETPRGQTSVIADAGVAWLITRDIQLDISAGSGVAGHTTPHPFLAAGISRRF